VLDAFWHENGYQLLVCMASGALNLVQLIVYAVSIILMLKNLISHSAWLFIS